MKFSTRMEGGQALAKALKALPEELSGPVKQGALREAAEPIRLHAERLAPRGPHSQQPRLSDNIVAGPQTKSRMEARGRQDESVMEVGPRAGKGGDEFFYGRFYEWGTSRQPARPFMRPAFDANTDASLDILVDELWAALKRAIPLGQGEP